MRIMFLECNDFQIKSKKNTISTLDVCPACFNTNISLIPLTRDETYELNETQRWMGDEIFKIKLQQ